MATILVVDDEILVCQVVLSILRHAGHSVKITQSGVGVDRIADSLTNLDLLIIDQQTMPISGQITARRFLVLHSNLKVIYMSGSGQETTNLHDGLLLDATIIAKPFTASSIRDAVSSSLAA